MEFLQKSWESVKGDQLIRYIVIGVILICIGAILEDGTISKICLNTSYAILGGGVFAAIVKSSDFTKIFKSHIADVFYDPEKIKSEISLIDRWGLITGALLKNVLPTAHRKAVEIIQKEFIISEAEYHYENYKVEYLIKVEPTTNIATIDQKTVTTIILSPHAKNPTLSQEMNSLTEWEISRLTLNGIDRLEKLKKERIGSLNKISLENLGEYAKEREGSKDRVIQFERVDTRTQDLSEDPYIAVKIIRYTKGAEVRAKISPDNYKLHFYRFGLGDLPDDHYKPNAVMGFDVWQIALPDCLQLPGQGFVIIPASM